MDRQKNQNLNPQAWAGEVPDERPLPPLSFIRRIYFLRDKPEQAIFFYHMQGDVTPPTVEEDWAREPMLEPYLDRKDEVDVLEWNAPDPAVEAVCVDAAWLGVRKDGDTYTVIDASDTLPQYEMSTEEVNEVLSALEAQVGAMTENQKARMRALQADAGVLRQEN